MAGTEAQPLPYSKYVVPVLLMIGWIAGCALMVYYVFS